MDLGELKKNWDAFGRIDPYWAILTVPGKERGGWDPEEFFKTGLREIEQVMLIIQQVGVKIKRDKMLDFGCGIGRISQAFSLYFKEVYGVDIAPSMIEQAKRHNRFPDKCKYYLIQDATTSFFPNNMFDLIYSNLTLQHMKWWYTKHYLAEFMRILSPGGLLIFQLPSPVFPNKRWRFIHLIRRALNDAIGIFPYSTKVVYSHVSTPLIMEMYFRKEKDVLNYLSGIGGKAVYIHRWKDAEGMNNIFYFIEKQ